MDIKHRPAILIGTPGRVADHFRRERFATEFIKTLVVDEFDKSLEIGFEPEMKDIAKGLPQVKQRILTSATKSVGIPDFLRLKNPETVDFLGESSSNLVVKRVLSPHKNKLNTLLDTLCHIGYLPGIVFCNLKETIQEVSDYLELNKIAHGCFYGDMELRDRERSLIKFRNGTHQLLLATDLAARGIDVPDLAFIIHFELPQSNKEYTHRNGRTARMNGEGTAYLIQWEKEELPDFARDARLEKLKPSPKPGYSPWKTLFVSGGRKDKISKGDIAGIFLKQGELKKEELGVIEIKQDCAFVGVHGAKAKELVAKLDNTRFKKKKVRITVI
jgi:superfamily II DNA/RNA helicase